MGPVPWVCRHCYSDGSIALYVYFGGTKEVPHVSITDPEATENKYIRITRITSPDAQFEYAVLIEFGVKQVNSDGFLAGVQPYGEACRQ